MHAVFTFSNFLIIYLNESAEREISMNTCSWIWRATFKKNNLQQASCHIHGAMYCLAHSKLFHVPKSHQRLPPNFIMCRQSSSYHMQQELTRHSYFSNNRLITQERGHTPRLWVPRLLRFLEATKVSGIRRC